MDSFLLKVYYSNLLPIHNPVKYVPIEFSVISIDGDGKEDGNGDGKEDGSGSGNGNGSGNGSGYGSGYGNGSG